MDIVQDLKGSDNKMKNEPFEFVIDEQSKIYSQF